MDSFYDMRAGWMQVIPRIPLEPAVPVFCADTGNRGVTFGHPVLHVLQMAGGVAGPIDAPDEDWCVDLGAPQGFAYALRWLLCQVSHYDVACVSVPLAHSTAMWLSQDYTVLRGEVTDRHRLCMTGALTCALGVGTDG